MIEDWDTLESQARGDYRVFSVREHRRRSPRTGDAHSFYVIESSDWVNIIPLTPEGQIVFVRQYRHGTEDVTLEVPGGMVDPEDASPGEAGRREMIEETGYDADEIVYLGTVAPNPAIQSNRCFTYLAPGARQIRQPSFDGTEDIEVTLVDPAEVPSLIVNGQITHSLVVAAFYFFDQHIRNGSAR